MAANQQELLETFGKMTVIELSEFVEAFKDRFNVTAAVAPVMAGPAEATNGQGEPAEQDEFEVVRRQEDPGHQGDPTDHQPGAKGGQGAGRQGSQHGQGSGQQGRRRGHQGKARGGWRQRCSQVGAPIRDPRRGAFGGNSRPEPAGWSSNRTACGWIASACRIPARNIRRDVRQLRQGVVCCLA